MKTNRVAGKKILVVDDEQDVLDSIEELLQESEIIKADSYLKGKEILENADIDIAVLDIMGVDGYRLLETAVKHNILTVMLTAHALSPDNIIRSFKEGAAYYIPKDQLSSIGVFLNDVLEAQETGQHFWGQWIKRLGSYMEKKFGPKWQEDDKEFWKKFPFYE